MQGGEKALAELVGASHSGMSVDTFIAAVNDWFSSARHPETGPLLTSMSTSRCWSS